MKKVGVLLSGCGHLDGAEIRESVLTLLALDKAEVEVSILSLDVDQYHVVDHYSGETNYESRNVFEESARIARGKVHRLEQFDCTTLDAIILPGGYGVAKNFSNFAFKGTEAKINSDMASLILDFNKTKRPIGAICISPAVLCLVLGEQNPKVTVGNDKDTIDIISKLGADHVECKANEICVDERLRIVSTPAYMYDNAKISDVAEGIEKCVQKVIELTI